MSLRYGRLFDTTVRAEYERALTQAKAQLGPMPAPTATQLPLRRHQPTGTGGKHPVIKARLAGGYCLRTPAQGACAYANICEHCPSFHTDTTSSPILAAQRADTAVLAADAERPRLDRGSGPPPPLIARLDLLIAEAARQLTTTRPHPRPSTPASSLARRRGNPSPPTPSPPSPASAGPPSTGAPNSAPSSRNTANRPATRSPSPGWPSRSTSSATPSKPSPPTSAATKNNSADWNAPPAATPDNDRSSRHVILSSGKLAG